MHYVWLKNRPITQEVVFFSFELHTTVFVKVWLKIAKVNEA